jgi:hypothetical protein
MSPLFIASGPAFKTRYNHRKKFLNIDLYPLMLSVLQISPLEGYPSNGSLENVNQMLYNTEEDENTRNQL